ncbi:hypothetical protein E4U17_002172 [Claviceps sp. LM77 group G4]|nr:hypothetical protein E4U17_002172 [Claviceps sp. LM77 group G4]KAG6075449.1 hypothetical protein E4U33_002101 [Claviceps sp. LM78 group G4]KAG6078139.1 hypothetical protein E4U16_001828 [Claviceps sp. LM84 group G4]
MKLYPTLSPDLSSWAQRQPLFLTATAGTHTPRINVSPKGLTDTHFAILSPSQCAYIDRTGSGCETIAHVYENGRLCLMFMSFGQAPRILRLFCKASVVEYDDPRFGALVKRIAAGKREAFDGARAVIVADIWEVQTSCGFAVPRVKRVLYSGRGREAGNQPGERESDAGQQQQAGFVSGSDHDGEGEGGKADAVDELFVFEARPTLDKALEKSANKNTIRSYQRAHNVASLDGLPGLRASRRDAGERLWLGDLRAWTARRACEREAMAVGFVLATLLSLLLRWMGW